MNLWKINCMEDEYPGMWQRWFKNQCVAVGWPVQSGYSFEDKANDNGWIPARNRLNEIKEGDFIIVSLKGNRIGRIGEVIKSL